MSKWYVTGWAGLGERKGGYFCSLYLGQRCKSRTGTVSQVGWWRMCISLSVLAIVSPGLRWIILFRLNLLYLSASCSSSLNKAQVLDKIEICLCQWFKCKRIRPLLSSCFAMDLSSDQRWLTCVAVFQLAGRAEVDGEGPVSSFKGQGPDFDHSTSIDIPLARVS